ncbi:hypothetical protein L207DRAFT_530670 [Hyaloscypha variabilis F]|uniref:Uncharacterized protein n=1 Tax=Hyaloscypha variabilis (strain UAMH 11265 / GT02V1 / F) TaxID=1149755 RepID=A0A2J6RL82_HYAVF|nr:hypothetical protein L207DRAFT_530670 [Hyaloscypha variabilis F]
MRTGGRTTDGEGTPTKERPTVRSQGLPRGPNFPSCMSRLVDSMGDGCETTRWDGRCSTSSVGRGGDVQITTRSRSWRLSATAKLAWAPPQHDYSDTPASSAHGVAEKPNWKCRDAFHRVGLAWGYLSAGELSRPALPPGIPPGTAGRLGNTDSISSVVQHLGFAWIIGHRLRDMGKVDAAVDLESRDKLFAVQPPSHSLKWPQGTRTYEPHAEGAFPERSKIRRLQGKGSPFPPTGMSECQDVRMSGRPYSRILLARAETFVAPVSKTQRLQPGPRF